MSDSNVLVLAAAIVVILVVVVVVVTVRIQTVPLTFEGCYVTYSSWNSENSTVGLLIENGENRNCCMLGKSQRFC